MLRRCADTSQCSGSTSPPTPLAALALLYAARHPDRIRRLVLVTPSTRVVGIEVTDDDRREVAQLRHDEPWFAEAYGAFERIWAGTSTDADWRRITPFTYGRWDAETQARATGQWSEQNAEAAAAYYDGVDTDAVRHDLRQLHVPVLLLAGELDVSTPPARAAEYAALFNDAEVAVLPGSGHYPWSDDPAAFTTSVLRFLRKPVLSG